MEKGSRFRVIQSPKSITVSDAGFGDSLMRKYGIRRPGTKLSRVFLQGRAAIANYGIKQNIRYFQTALSQQQIHLQLGFVFPMTLMGINTDRRPAVLAGEAKPAGKTVFRQRPASQAQPRRTIAEPSTAGGSAAPEQSQPGRILAVPSTIGGGAAQERHQPAARGFLLSSSAEQFASPLVIRGTRRVETIKDSTTVQAVGLHHHAPAASIEGREIEPARLILSRGNGTGGITGLRSVGFEDRIRSSQHLLVRGHTMRMKGIGEGVFPAGGRGQASLISVDGRMPPIVRGTERMAPVETAALIHREKEPVRAAAVEQESLPDNNRPNPQFQQPVDEEMVLKRQATAATNTAQPLSAAELQKLSDQVYRHLEQRLRMERQRKGW